MKLEVGKKYMDWGGEVVTIIGFDGYDNTYAGDDGEYYMEDGGLYGNEELCLSEFEEEPVFDPISELHAGNKVVLRCEFDEDLVFELVSDKSDEDETRFIMCNGHKATNSELYQLVAWPETFEEYIEPDEVELVDGEWYWIALSKTEVVPGFYLNDCFTYGETVKHKDNILVISHIAKPEFA